MVCEQLWTVTGYYKSLWNVFKIKRNVIQMSRNV